MSKKDLLKDLEELAATLREDAERTGNKAATANNYWRGFYRGCSISDEISSDSLSHIIKKHTRSIGI